MLTIDQSRIDAPNFPRDLEWWREFVPAWIRPTVHDNGTVTFEPSGRNYDYGGPDPSVIVDVDLTEAQKRSQEQGFARWVRNTPRLAAAIVEPATAQHQESA